MYKRLFLNKKMRSSFINNKIGCIDEEYEFTPIRIFNAPVTDVVGHHKSASPSPLITAHCVMVAESVLNEKMCNNLLRVDINEKIYYSCFQCKYVVISLHNTCQHSRCDFCLEKTKTCIICKCMGITK